MYINTAQSNSGLLKVLHYAAKEDMGGGEGFDRGF
jgi:hypothetical protein